MDNFLTQALLALTLFVLFIFFVWLIVLQSQLSRLTDKLTTLLKEKETLPRTAPQAVPAPTAQEPTSLADEPQASPIQEPAARPQATVAQASVAPAPKEPGPQPVVSAAAVPPAEENPQTNPVPTPRKASSKPISFVELFSWIGGFILLLGVLFWIKYALENNLISPVMRITLGTIAGIVMWAVGAVMRKPQVKTTSDTLCACGLCTCYAVWFAAYYFYHMASPAVTFVLLALIALASFATAVWKRAQYIGVLAQLVGFVTPFLFPSDSPRIWFLLAYTGLINAAAVAAAIKRNWTHQLFTGLAFTFLCFLAIIEVGTPLQLAFFPGVFALLYAAVAVQRKQTPLLRASFALAALGLLVLGIQSPSFSIQSTLCLMGFGTIFSIGFGVLATWQKNQELYISALGFALLAFVLLAKSASFLPLYIFVLLLCAAFSVMSVALKKQSLQAGSMALAALGFIVLSCGQAHAFLQSAHLPYLTAFTILFALSFGLIAYKQRNKELFLYTVVLTILCFGWLVPFKNEFYLTAIASIFTLFFGITSARMKDFDLQLASVLFTSICTILICTLGKMNLHLIIGGALAAAIFYGYFAVKQKSGALFGTAAASMVIPFLMLCTYTMYNHRGSELIGWLVAWNLLVVFTPLYFKKHFENDKTAWAAVPGCDLLAGTLLLLVFQTTPFLRSSVGPLSFFLFAIFAVLAQRVFHWQKLEEGIQKYRLSGLAWAPIVFLTFGILHECTLEWKTIALALEGATLIWLWRTVKLDFLQHVGLGILCLSAARLLLNPSIAHYYPQTQPLLNWYLYTYLICAGAMFAGARYWRPTEEASVPNALRALGGILLFALVNIEIACYHTGGSGLSFNICGEEAGIYTVAWTICGALCMFLSTKKSLALLRVGIGLIAVAVLKLLMVDIWKLSSGLRVASLFAVAIIMLGVSFIYQQVRRQKH